MSGTASNKLLQRAVAASKEKQQASQTKPVQPKTKPVIAQPSPIVQEQPVVHAPAERSMIAATTYLPIDGIYDRSEYPELAKKVARTDVPPANYGVSSKAVNVGIFNKEVDRWASGFSSENQFNGGCAINKATLYEVCLDFVFYDLGIQPEGFKSVEELRALMRSKLK